MSVLGAKSYRDGVILDVKADRGLKTFPGRDDSVAVYQLIESNNIRRLQVCGLRRVGFTVYIFFVPVKLNIGHYRIDVNFCLPNGYGLCKFILGVKSNV